MATLTAPKSVLKDFHPCTRTWFEDSFAAPTKAQIEAWPFIRAGQSTLLLAPTGSGKTLAAFLAGLDRIMFGQSDQPSSSSVKLLYVSPLKALGVDIDRNLRSPIAGIRAVAERQGEVIHVPDVAIRSGDTTSEERQNIVRHPPEVLITTPESLYLMLTSKACQILQSVETVIIDEIHVMVPTKRGAHLFLTLERLERLRRAAAPDIPPLQRIGLSATQRPLDEIARLLAGADATSNPDQPPLTRPVQIVNATEPKRLELRVETPVEDMGRIGSLAESIGNAAAGPSPPSIWTAIHPRLVELIREHRSTMIFVNSRRLAERLAAAINELADEEIALSHHGSVAKDQRREIEDRLKRGQLPAIVATSSLELGIDMGAVDLVIQIEAPPTIAAGIQRIGRSGRGIDLTSNGVIFPKYRGDLLACAGATGRMLAGEVEETFYPRKPLDLLAQQIVAMVAREPIETDEIYTTVRSAAPYADLSKELFESVLDLLSGKYPSDEFAELRPRVNWDRTRGVVSPRRGTQRLAVLNGGTIPDRGLYGVFLVGDGPDGTGGQRVGELDEEMVFETRPGDVFLLGASSWRVLEITKDRVLVAPAPGEPGRMPFWRGDGLGRPLEFGRAIGRLARTLSEHEPETAAGVLEGDHRLDRLAASNLLQYLQDQREATGEPPSEVTIIVESFVDEIGDWRVCVLSPLGSRVHAPWAMAVAARLREEDMGEVDFSWTDDGIVFRLPESPEPPPTEFFVPRADDVEQQVTNQLGGTALFSARFRENAARALLLPRRQPNRRTPLWLQRRKSADLLAAASRFPDFPILLETYRECLRDVFDLPGLKDVLRQIERHEIRIQPVQTEVPSPFAASLLFNYIGNFLYDGDAPLAERRAQALTLDHSKLRELLGNADLRDLLNADVIAELELQLQKLTGFVARDADDVHDLLLSLGDLSVEEIAARCVGPATDADQLDRWTEELLVSRRAIQARVAGVERLIAAEDAARYRDALGVNLPTGLPEAFLDRVPDALSELVSRFARTHVPFKVADVAQRFGLGEATVKPTLDQLSERGKLLSGEFVPNRRGLEWCDAEVLKTIKRRSLAALRAQVEAVPPESLANFLPFWHGITHPRKGLDGVLDVVEQLQGAPLPVSTLESEILPARVKDYTSALLDELFLAGEIVWQGVDSIGQNDGRISLYLTDQFEYLGSLQPGESGESEDADELAMQVRSLLTDRGALRFEQLAQDIKAFPNDLLMALWRLVWGGEVTNDTLAPLRSLVRQATSPTGRRVESQRRKRDFRSRRRTRLAGSEGRWSLLRMGSDTDQTERQTAIAQQLVQRHGILTRNAISREQLPGGFSSIYLVLKAMEESGKLRRGYFVEGLGGVQFAAPGADDAIRQKTKDDEPAAVLLAATDPANAYGAAIPWPKIDEDSARLMRAPGAQVVLQAGRLLAYLGRSRRSLTTFLDRERPSWEENCECLAKALADSARKGPSIMITKIDNQPPEQSPIFTALIAAGFVGTSRGLVFREKAKTHIRHKETPVDDSL